jgi:hypothetical protein
MFQKQVKHLNYHKRRYIFGVIGWWTLLACTSSAPSDETQPLAQGIYKGLLSPFFFQEERLREPNFPFWFNDSLIRQHRIKSITITHYVVDVDAAESIQKRTVFGMDNDGLVNQIEYSNWYDGKIISSEKLSLEPVNLFYSRTSPIPAGTSEIRTFKLHTQNDSLLVLHADDGSDQRVFLLDAQIQNVHVIDQMFKTDVFTRWYYGSPLRYHEWFALENMVNQPVQHKFEWNDQDLLVAAEQKDRFRTRKTYHYSDEMLWLGYQDSIFSLGGDFIRMEQAAIEYDQQELPQGINHFGGISPDQMFVKAILKFDYEFYE